METIGVNLLWLEPGVVGGSEEYTLSLLRAVHDLDPLDIELKLFAQQGLIDHHPDLEKRFEVLIAPKLPGGKAGRIAAEHTWLARQSADVRVVHHAGGVIPAGTAGPSMLTVLDLQPLDMPENFGPVKRNWLGQMIPRSLEQAVVIVAPSRFTASRITGQFDVDPQRVHVVPFALNDLTVPIDPSPTPVFVYPAIAYAHKRHSDLIEAFAILRIDHPDAELVLTGAPGPLTDAVRKQITAAGLDESVTLTGRIPRDELMALMGAATAVVIPSEYEGFGVPALEAMSLGTPVIVADAGSSPEIVGGCGIVVPPRQPARLAHAMHRVIVDPDHARRFGEAGIQRAANFGWEKSGRALVDAYRDALAGSP